MIKAQRTISYTVTSSITRRKVQVRTTIVATYRGGAYVDLTFVNGAAPAEVINVWNYRLGASTLDEKNQQGLAACLGARIFENDEQERIDNDGYDVGRTWLRAYVDNSVAA